MGSYIPSTLAERKEMLASIGVNSLDDLYVQVPAAMKLKKLDLPVGKSELEVVNIMEELSLKNKVFSAIFRGAGAYNHYIPAIVKSVTSKEEFVTAYTPYQAEISQGILQSIFEYQTMICELTGMDVSNASVYDGASAAAEAVLMFKDKKKPKALISGSVNPMVIRTVQTYCKGSGIELVVVPTTGGVTDIEALEKMADSTVSCVYMQQPNYYGIIEDAEKIGEISHSAGAKYIMGVNPIAVTIIKTPAEYGADVAVGEGQPLGMPLAFGGPYLGFMATTKPIMRKLPGRIVGETKDVDGKRAYVLTLQAREQHIRREKASSNICSNQALCALMASVFMTAMGADGIKEMANQCLSKAHYTAKSICEIKGFEMKFSGEFFHEFVTTCPIKTNILMAELEKKGILGGYPVDDGILWCVTEMNSKAQIDTLVSIIKEVCKG
ncbi:MAG: aminomethyl-transferring glycine dehydrogenase subunit GcvPA [Clostridia bacterium]|nr:aminomethyl-transferring glycine dehydrogenase subunit GcvPA [Clostridia bacterium]